MIKIRKSECADTRTCDWSKVTKKTLLENTNMHKRDVFNIMRFLMIEMLKSSANHDWSKIEHLDQFHAEFITGFATTEWYKMHQKVERHHLKKEEYVQEDVNLIDVIEMISDNIAAGVARSGEYRKEEIPSELLKLAFDNTIKLILKNIELED